jgi:hypothetical protein
MTASNVLIGLDIVKPAVQFNGKYFNKEVRKTNCHCDKTKNMLLNTLLGCPSERPKDKPFILMHSRHLYD